MMPYALLLASAVGALTALDGVAVVLDRARGEGPHPVALVVLVEDATAAPEPAAVERLAALVRHHPKVQDLVVLPTVVGDPGRRALADLAAEHGVAYVLVLRVMDGDAPAQLELLDELGAVLPARLPAADVGTPPPQVTRQDLTWASESDGAARMATYVDGAWQVHWLPGVVPGLFPLRPRVVGGAGALVPLAQVAATPGTSPQHRATLLAAARTQRRADVLLGWTALTAFSGAVSFLLVPCLGGAMACVGSFATGYLCTGDVWEGIYIGVYSGVVVVPALTLAAAVLVGLTTLAALGATGVPGVLMSLSAANGLRPAVNTVVRQHNRVLANGLGLPLEEPEAPEADAPGEGPPAPPGAAD